MRIYLAGPMRGYPDFNFPAFIAAAAWLRAAGHEVFNPAERDLDNGFSPGPRPFLRGPAASRPSASSSPTTQGRTNEVHDHVE